MTRKAGLFKFFNKKSTPESESTNEETTGLKRRQPGKGNQRRSPKRGRRQRSATAEQPQYARTQSGHEFQIKELATQQQKSVFYRHHVPGASEPRRPRSSSAAVLPHAVPLPSLHDLQPSHSMPHPSRALPQDFRIEDDHGRHHRRHSSADFQYTRQHRGHYQSRLEPIRTADGSDEDDALFTPIPHGNATPANHKTTLEIKRRRHSMQSETVVMRKNSGSTSLGNPSPSSKNALAEGRSPSQTPNTRDGSTKGEGASDRDKVSSMSKKECKLIVALMNEPRNKKLRNKYVRYLIKKGRYAEAENIFEVGCKNFHPDDWQLQFQFGVFCYDFLNKPHKAETYLSTALSMNPSASCIHTHLGILVRRRGNHERAEAHFVDALKFNPLDFTALAELVELLRDDDRYELAYDYLMTTYQKLSPDLDSKEIDIISFRHVLQLAEDIAAKISVSSPVPDYAHYWE